MAGSGSEGEPGARWPAADPRCQRRLLVLPGPWRGVCRCARAQLFVGSGQQHMGAEQYAWSVVRFDEVLAASVKAGTAWLGSGCCPACVACLVLHTFRRSARNACLWQPHRITLSHPVCLFLPLTNSLNPARMKNIGYLMTERGGGERLGAAGERAQPGRL